MTDGGDDGDDDDDDEAVKRSNHGTVKTIEQKTEILCTILGNMQISDFLFLASDESSGKKNLVDENGSPRERTRQNDEPMKTSKQVYNLKSIIRFCSAETGAKPPRMLFSFRHSMHTVALEPRGRG